MYYCGQEAKVSSRNMRSVCVCVCVCVLCVCVCVCVCVCAPAYGQDAMRALMYIIAASPSSDMSC